MEVKTIKDFKLYTIEEVSEILKVTPRTIYKFIKNEQLKAVKIGKYWRITDTALQEFINNGTSSS